VLARDCCWLAAPGLVLPSRSAPGARRRTHPRAQRAPVEVGARQARGSRHRDHPGGPLLQGPGAADLCQGGSLTLTRIIPNGFARERRRFDRRIRRPPNSSIARATRRPKFVTTSATRWNQKARSESRRRREARRPTSSRPEADLAKARIEVQKGTAPQRHRRAEERGPAAAIAARHVESLNKSNAFHGQFPTAPLCAFSNCSATAKRWLWKRTQGNIAKMQVRAPLAGMVAHQTVYRNSSWATRRRATSFTGIRLCSAFSIHRNVGHLHGGATRRRRSRGRLPRHCLPGCLSGSLTPGAFESASPVASSAFGSPIKTFTRRCSKLDKTDPHLMPDLSGRAGNRSARRGQMERAREARPVLGGGGRGVLAALGGAAAGVNHLSHVASRRHAAGGAGAAERFSGDRPLPGRA